MDDSKIHVHRDHVQNFHCTSKTSHASAFSFLSDLWNVQGRLFQSAIAKKLGANDSKYVDDSKCCNKTNDTQESHSFSTFASSSNGAHHHMSSNSTRGLVSSKKLGRRKASITESQSKSIPRRLFGPDSMSLKNSPFEGNKKQGPHYIGNRDSTAISSVLSYCNDDSSCRPKSKKEKNKEGKKQGRTDGKSTKEEVKSNGNNGKERKKKNFIGEDGATDEKGNSPLSPLKCLSPKSSFMIVKETLEKFSKQVSRKSPRSSKVTQDKTSPTPVDLYVHDEANVLCMLGHDS